MLWCIVRAGDNGPGRHSRQVEGEKPEAGADLQHRRGGRDQRIGVLVDRREFREGIDRRRPAHVSTSRVIPAKTVLVEQYPRIDGHRPGGQHDPGESRSKTEFPVIHPGPKSSSLMIVVRASSMASSDTRCRTTSRHC